MKTRILYTLAVLAAATAVSNADILITEWAYQGNGGEFIEITNTGDTAVSLANYSFDDDSRVPGTVSLATLGTLAPGESAIITELAATTFRAEWSLASTVKVLGNNAVNLGRADEINIYDGTTLVDRLTYNDQTGDGPRTNNNSGVTAEANWGLNLASAWFLSGSGSDTFAITWTSASGSKGSPGVTQ